MIPSLADGAQARLTIDLGALQANWQLLASRASPAACAAVVKADAYGIGIARAVPALAEAGCRTFFVAHLSEGVRARHSLQQAGTCSDAEIDIFLLHGLQPGPVAHADMFAFRLGPVLGSVPELELWADLVKARSDAPSSAVQLDTGMNRIGLAPANAQTVAPALVAACKPAYVISHFSAAEEQSNPRNDRQIALFDELRRRVCPALPASLANSSGIFLPQRPHYDLVRPGYALYGGNPCPGYPNPMRPVVTLEAAILQTRLVAAGEGVGYNGRWVASRPSRLATIGVGYADGVPRGAPTLGTGDGPTTLVGGVPCPLVGRLSMDLAIVDVTDAPAHAVEPGTWIELIGATTTVDDFGAGCGTIGYEILTNLGRRYSRAYVDGGATRQACA